MFSGGSDRKWLTLKIGGSFNEGGGGVSKKCFYRFISFISLTFGIYLSLYQHLYQLSSGKRLD